MKRADVDLIQRWIYFEGLNERQIHERINSYKVNININIDAAIQVAKLQKEYERGNIPLENLLAAYKEHNIIK